MARKTYDEVKTHCVVCTNLVPEERAGRGGVTCSPECLTIRKAAQRAERDAKECRYCRKPSTLEARAAFNRFRRLEAKRPDLLYPDEFKAWAASLPIGLAPTANTFAKHLVNLGMLDPHPWTDERQKRVEARKDSSEPFTVKDSLNEKDAPWPE
jgi:predicted nucleic acid-binding Zn ribbon protein